MVNVYSQQDCLTSASPSPLKTLMNLVTPVTSLVFNPASEILAMASKNEDEALRLVSPHGHAQKTQPNGAHPSAHI